ncbi:MAG: aldo/keto reductase [Burkholderiales bacterium]|nr:aldo/keto reductase [Phycisphaerae bacterium]
MEKRTLGKTGYEVSVLGFGAAPAAFLDSDKQTAAAMVEALLDQGVNLIDTATSYPGSHEFLGEYLSHRRDDFVLVTKCGGKMPDIDAPDWSERLITHAVETALKTLKTDHLDVMLLHTCDLATLKAGEALGALVKAREAGRVKFIGYSGDNEAAVWAAGRPEVAVIETSVNIVELNNIDTVLPACLANNVGVLAKRPIANACWRDAAQRKGIYRNYVTSYADRLATMELKPADLGYDGNPDEAWPSIALRFTLGQSDVTTAIVGTTNPDNATKNLRYASEGPLPAGAMDKIRAAFRAADPSAGWPGLT